MVDAATGDLIQTGLDDTYLQLSLVDGRKLEAGGEREDFLDSCQLLLNKGGQPLLAHGRSGSYAPDGRVLVPIIAGQAMLPDLKVTDSSEALLTGRAPPFRLLARVVLRGGIAVTGVAPVLSEPFVVATARVKGAAKAEIPHVNDHISKVEGLGIQTQKKLEDIAAAAAAAGVANLQVPINNVTRVGQFKDLVETAEHSKPLRETLKQVLRLTKGWDVARDHVRKAVHTDDQLRVFHPEGRQDVGLVYKCSAFNVVDINHPVGLLRRRQQQDREDQQLVDVIWLGSEYSSWPEAVRKMVPRGASAWWRDGHPGWSFLPLNLSHLPKYGSNNMPNPAIASYAFTMRSSGQNSGYSMGGGSELGALAAGFSAAAMAGLGMNIGSGGGSAAGPPRSGTVRGGAQAVDPMLMSGNGSAIGGGSGGLRGGTQVPHQISKRTISGGDIPSSIPPMITSTSIAGNYYHRAGSLLPMQQEQHDVAAAAAAAAAAYNNTNLNTAPVPAAGTNLASGAGSGGGADVLMELLGSHHRLPTDPLSIDSDILPNLAAVAGDGVDPGSSPFEEPAFQQLMQLVAANNNSSGGVGIIHGNNSGGSGVHRSAPRSNESDSSLKAKRKADTSLETWMAMHPSSLDIDLPGLLAGLESAPNSGTLLPTSLSGGGGGGGGLLLQRQQQHMHHPRVLSNEAVITTPFAKILSNGNHGNDPNSPRVADFLVAAQQHRAAQRVQRITKEAAAPQRQGSGSAGVSDPNSTRSGSVPDTAPALIPQGVTMGRLREMFAKAVKQEISFSDVESFLSKNGLLPVEHHHTGNDDIGGQAAGHEQIKCIEDKRSDGGGSGLATGLSDMRSIEDTLPKYGEQQQQAMI